VIAGVVLAAGGSSRYGAPKQLAQLDGRPLLEHALGTLHAVPELGRIVVVLGAEAERIRDATKLEGAEVVVAREWPEGIAASLRAGVAAAGDAEAIVIVLGDQPLITPAAVKAVLAALGDAPAARATFDGAPGHPVAIRRGLFEELAALRGDSGARELLEAHGVTAVECAGLADGADVDRPGDLEAIARSMQAAEVSG
jgi:CTP:molybdopterin cytidylyltransferase MocA